MTLSVVCDVTVQRRPFGHGIADVIHNLHRELGQRSDEGLFAFHFENDRGSWQDAHMPDYTLFGDEHVRQYEATGGEVGHDWNGTSCLVLSTTGRKSGKTRKFALIYGRDGEDYVLIASKGGAPTNPGWYENLVAHPAVTIQVRDEIIAVTARTGTPEDKKRVWPMMAMQWPGYDDYQAGSSRDIPVVLLRPR